MVDRKPGVAQERVVRPIFEKTASGWNKSDNSEVYSHDARFYALSLDDTDFLPYSRLDLKTLRGDAFRTFRAFVSSAGKPLRSSVRRSYPAVLA